MSFRAFVALIAMLGVAACQPLPQPFQPDDKEDNPLLVLGGAAGVLVLPVSGAPGAVTTRLAEAMAEALGRADVLASTTAVNAESHQLHGRVATTVEDQQRATLEIEWRVIAPDGREAGIDIRQEVVMREPWYRGDMALLRRLVQPSVRPIASAIQGEAPTQAAPTPLRQRRVAVSPVDGAPGDGRIMLQRALSEALRQSGMIVVPVFDAESLVVLGTVTASPPERGRQRVQISWAVIYPDGSEAGRIDQDSQVVAGSLDGAWGETAYDVALGAAQGVRELLRSLPNTP